MDNIVLDSICKTKAAIPVVFTLLFLLSNATAQAQSGYTASVVPNGNTFECSASGFNVPVHAPSLWIYVLIYGNVVNPEPYAPWGTPYYEDFTPSAWYGQWWSIDLFDIDWYAESYDSSWNETPLHGHHTCEFVCTPNSSGESDYWDITTSYTFP